MQKERRKKNGGMDGRKEGRKEGNEGRKGDDEYMNG
jgi:hypothetical protein